jgi:hypothetical protein
MSKQQDAYEALRLLAKCISIVLGLRDIKEGHEVEMFYDKTNLLDYITLTDPSQIS